jgi:hypothetical protein
VPLLAGDVVAADWDLLATGTYPEAADFGVPRPGVVTLTATYAFSEPGTYFSALRATSQREGNPDTPYARIQNLGRVRVVVR